MIIPESYYTEELNIKLTQDEIEKIITQLENTNHNIFELCDFQKIIDKLRQVKK